MKKCIKIALIALALLVSTAFFALCAGAAGNTVVYLKSDGTGDGSSPETAVGTLTNAYDALDLSQDCTIVLCGEMTQSSSFNCRTKYDGKVTITSVYGGVDYRKTAGAVFITGEYRYVCTGEIEFKDVDFHLTGKYFFVVGQHNPVTIGDGVTMDSASDGFTGAAFGSAFSILGGYQNGQVTTYEGKEPPTSSDEPVNITVRSGKNILIAAYSRQIKGENFSGKAVINIEGDAYVTKLYYAPVNTDGLTDCNADVVLNIRDNAYVESIVGGTNNASIGSLTMNWESGDILSFMTGAVASVAVTTKNGCTLNYSDAASKSAFFPIIKLAFDTTTLIGGASAADTTATAKDTTATAPAETSAPFTADGTAVYIVAALILAALSVLFIVKKRKA